MATKTKGEKSNSSLGIECGLNCVLLQWRLNFGILPGDGAMFLHHCTAIHNSMGKPYPYTKTRKTEENCGQWQLQKAVRQKKEDQESHKMK